jgi:ABC-type phosphate transport system auxiliary subunit
MKVPKAQLIKDKLTVPENRTRFILDIDNQTQRGKDIIALMNRLQAEDPKANKAVDEILAALADLVK